VHDNWFTYRTTIPLSINFWQVDFVAFSYEKPSFKIDCLRKNCWIIRPKIMKIIIQGILNHSQADSDHAILTGPSLTVLTDGTLLALYRAGTGKDTPDGHIELRRSIDGGNSWQPPEHPFPSPIISGVVGSLRLAYITEIAKGQLIAAALWIDRGTYPGKPLFNGETEGCLPMSVLVADSADNGQTWSTWRVVPVPDDIGPASLTNTIVKLPDGILALSIESNKHYLDAGKWQQRVVMLFSADNGQNWSTPVNSGFDPSGRTFNWDQRAAVSPDGRLATFTWTYDSQEQRYRNIHRRISSDSGHSWSVAEDLGFADQAAHPAILPDGRVVLAWVDRFGSQSIRARIAAGIAQPFDPASEVVIYEHNSAEATAIVDTGDLLETMGLWSFGLPYAEALPNGDVLVVYYAGSNLAMDIRWCRLRL
jgi:hypothetical protein